MKKMAIIFVSVVVIYLVSKVMTRPKLEYFNASEFGIWWLMMSREQLLALDAFRKAWGSPVQISKAGGSLGRNGGEGDKSQHNIDKWGEVRATDVFPMLPDEQGGYRYMQTAQERQRAYDTALQVGFTGIGLYTDTKPGNLLHLDTRKADRVALWSRVNGEYLGIGEVLV